MFKIFIATLLLFSSLAHATFDNPTTCKARVITTMLVDGLYSSANEVDSLLRSSALEKGYVVSSSRSNEDHVAIILDTVIDRGGLFKNDSCTSTLEIYQNGVLLYSDTASNRNYWGTTDCSNIPLLLERLPACE